MTRVINRAGKSGLNEKEREALEQAKQLIEQVRARIKKGRE
ncbi:hypothetical protein ACFLV0_00495 [Chloroflexota bacterium]